MIYQNDKNENTQNQFSNALKELKLENYYETPTLQNPVAFLHMKYFNFYCCLYSRGRNLFRFLNSKHKDQAVSKNTCSFSQ